MLCLKLTKQIREQCCSCPTPQLCRADCWQCHEEKQPYIWDSCDWGWVQLLLKSVTAAYLPFISPPDVGTKGRACWSHLTQITSSSHLVSHCWDHKIQLCCCKASTKDIFIKNHCTASKHQWRYYFGLLKSVQVLDAFPSQKTTSYKCLENETIMLNQKHMDSSILDTYLRANG